MAGEQAADIEPPTDDDAESGLSRPEREAGMGWIIWDGVLASSMVTLNGGVFLTGFALLLGASETVIGVLSGLPRYSALMQPLGSYFVERLRSRKGISVWVFGPARLLWVLVIALPLLGYRGGASSWALWVLIGVTAASYLMAGFAAVSWLAWMADLIPGDRRGKYFSRRTMLSGISGAVVGYVAGKFLDLWKDSAGPQDAGGFLIVFALATVCGLASWYTLVRCPEPATAEPEEAEPPAFGRVLRGVLADGNFRQALYATSILSFGVWIASPFFTVYMIKGMGLPYSIIAICTAASSVGSLLMVRFWGRLTDHFGSHPVMSACINGASLLPALWLLTAGGAWWPILIAHFLGGASWSGYMLAQMNLVFKITPSEHKAVYIGMFYALDALPTLVAPLLGGLLLQHTPHWAIHVGSWTYVNYHILFLASSLTRFAATPVLRRVKEPESKDLRHMVRVLSHFRSLNPVLGLQYYGTVMTGAAGRGTRGAVRIAKRTARAIRDHVRPDKLEGAD